MKIPKVSSINSWVTDGFAIKWWQELLWTLYIANLHVWLSHIEWDIKMCFLFKVAIGQFWERKTGNTLYTQ